MFKRIVLTVGVCVYCLVQPLSAQDASTIKDPVIAPETASDTIPVPDAVAAADQIDKRIFGVLPNYRTGNLKAPYEPLTVRLKFYIGFKDSTDYPIFGVSAVLSGLGQLTDQHPQFGQGVKGFAHRFATATADTSIGNFLSESVMPSVFHQDPRYFRKGEGSVGGRLGYAASRIFVAKNDSGRWNFNYSEVLGNAMGVGIANAYYPGERKLSDNISRLYSQLATDAFSQVLKEFWPDVKRKFLSKKN